MKNFNSNRFLFILTILLLIVNAITLGLLWSNKNHENNNKNPVPAFEFISKELKLDEQQQKLYDSLRKEHHSLQQPLMDSIRKAKDDFFDLLKQSSVTDSAIQQYNQRTAAFTQALDLLNFKHFKQLRELCTAEQQAKFDKIIKLVLRQMAGPKPPPGRPGQRPDQIQVPPQGANNDFENPPPPDGPPDEMPPIHGK